MERSSLKMLAPALFVLLLLSFMGEVLGSRMGILKEMPEDHEKYSMKQVAEVVAEVAIMAANNGNVNLKKALLRAETLQCADEGDYCNTLTGPNCCSGIACVQAPLAGGVCHKW